MDVNANISILILLALSVIPYLYIAFESQKSLDKATNWISLSLKESEKISTWDFFILMQIKEYFKRRANNYKSSILPGISLYPFGLLAIVYFLPLQMWLQITLRSGVAVSIFLIMLNDFRLQHAHWCEDIAIIAKSAMEIKKETKQSTSSSQLAPTNFDD
jgi:hypothetical protein